MEYDAWLRQSTTDFEVAKKNYLNKDYYVVAFFCQQAVEKALTLFLLKRIKRFSKSMT
ncbi:HEPN domain-containing protein [Candidatus Woesearchaeota archaeon]|nr:HEPN domain-containing protein [Candidatus Woesearchaeota archaeon]